MTSTNTRGAPVALFLFDRSGIMAQPWLDAGYECWLIDGQHEMGVHVDSDNPLKVRFGVWIDDRANKGEFLWKMSTYMEGRDVQFVFGFPECTDLAVSGARHFTKKAEANPDYRNVAMANVLLVRDLGEHFNAPYGIENPVSVISTEWRKPNFTFNPYDFGGYLPEDDVHPEFPDYIQPRDAYPKKTCIWSGQGFIEPVHSPVHVESGYSTQHKKLGGKSLKTKNIRSATPRGFAKAVFAANGLHFSS